LIGYAGAVVLVTHDRALIDAVATRTWAIEDGGIREVLGGYTDLLRVRDRERRDREREAQRAISAARISRGGGAPRANPQTGNRELRRLEEEIAAIEAELKEARNRLLDPETFANVERGAEAGREHDRLSGALAELYERWSEVGAAG
jgi:ATP-binding cassette subfamily F protein 3